MNVELLVGAVAVGSVIAIAMAGAWYLAGAWIRGKKVAPPTRREAVRYLSFCFIMLLLLFVIVPMVIQAFDKTYPVSINYFLGLTVAIVGLMAFHVKSYRTQPSQQSAFIVILGVAALGVAICVFFMLFLAIASSALT